MYVWHAYNALNLVGAYVKIEACLYAENQNHAQHISGIESAGIIMRNSHDVVHNMVDIWRNNNANHQHLSWRLLERALIIKCWRRQALAGPRARRARRARRRMAALVMALGENIGASCAAPIAWPSL